MIENFTPWSALLGGALIGLSSLGVFGRVAGISSILGRLFTPRAGDMDWRLTFLIGLVVAPLVYTLITQDAIAFVIQGSPWLLGIAGVLVGFGARLGNGCTSGHGICGISRFSTRSLVAVATFMATAIIVNLVI